MSDELHIARDDSLTEEAARYLLMGGGTHPASGLAESLGYEDVQVRPFGTKGADVWFFRANDPNCCGCSHVEFGRTGGDMMILGTGGEG